MMKSSNGITNMDDSSEQFHDCREQDETNVNEDGGIMVNKEASVRDDDSYTTVKTQPQQNANLEEEKDEEIVNNVDTNENDSIHQNQDDDNSSISSSERLEPLINSNRLKSYIIILFLSSVAFISAYESDLEHKILKHDIPPYWEGGSVPYVVPAPRSGRIYALICSGLSSILAFIILLIFIFDVIFRLSDQSILKTIFQPKSKIECLLVIFFIIWWVVGTAIITSARGVAGDGKGQHNLYFSVWLCCATTLNMFEKWLIAAEYSSVRQSVSSWPNRAPRWIMVLFLTLCNLICVIDLHNNRFETSLLDTSTLFNHTTTCIYYPKTSKSQWYWLIFACSFSAVVALCCCLAELFRKEGDEVIENTQSKCESAFEGIILLILVGIWIPTVSMATTVNGAASEVGNAYFFTWGSTVVVIHTFINWLQDWRKGVHEIMALQDRAYRQVQENVLKKEYSYDENYQDYIHRRRQDAEERQDYCNDLDNDLRRHDHEEMKEMEIDEENQDLEEENVKNVDVVSF